MILFPYQDCVSSLKKEEGYRQHMYQCSEHVWTIGIGRVIEPRGLGISETEAEFLLKNDIDRSIKECQKSFSFFNELSPNRQRAMVELCFQLGLTTLLKFKRMIAALESEAFDQAAIELLDSRFAKQTPGRAKRMAQLIEAG